MNSHQFLIYFHLPVLLKYSSQWHRISTLDSVDDRRADHMQCMGRSLESALASWKLFTLRRLRHNWAPRFCGAATPSRPTYYLLVWRWGWSLLPIESVDMTSSLYATYYAHTSSDRRPCNVFVYIVAIKYLSNTWLSFPYISHVR